MITPQDLMQLAEKGKFRILFKHLDTFFNKDLDDNYRILRHKILHELVQGNTQQTSYLSDLEIFLNKATINVTSDNTEIAASEILIKKEVLSAIYHNPNDYEAWHNLGEIYAYENNLEKALDAYHKAIKIKPNHAKSLYRLGTLYYVSQEYSKEVSFYFKAIESNSNHYETWLALGWYYVRIKEYELGLNAHFKAIEIDPASIQGWHSLRGFYAQFNEHKKSINITHFLLP